MPKAILITDTNYQGLENDWEYEEDELKSCVGMYLIGDFGTRTPGYGIITLENLDASFVKTGVELQNGYFEVVLNDAQRQ